jgi:hypothetical protein
MHMSTGEIAREHARWEAFCGSAAAADVTATRQSLPIANHREQVRHFS